MILCTLLDVPDYHVSRCVTSAYLMHAQFHSTLMLGLQAVLQPALLSVLTILLAACILTLLLRSHIPPYGNAIPAMSIFETRTETRAPSSSVWEKDAPQT
jgi:hypothetical protein